MRRGFGEGRRVGNRALAIAGVTLMVMLVSVQAQQPPAPRSGQQPAASAQQPPTSGQQPPAGAPRGQQPAGNQGAPAPPGTPTKALVPVAASTLAANPDRFYGEFVTLTGTVESSLAPKVFSVDQDKTKSTGKDVLVVARRMSGPVDLNTYITVIGEVLKFDPAQVAAKSKDFAVDLPADVVEKYRGKPVILATGVINAAMVDLAKFIPPPMTPEEAAYDKVMKSVGPANGALRKALEGSNVDLLKEQLAVLRKAFADTEAFWKARGKADALKLAQDARKEVEAIEVAGVAAKWDEVKAHIGTLGQTCQGCHSMYRERGEDGSFFIKPGSTSK